MREFGSLGKFADHLLALQVTELVALNRGLERCAKLVEATAKAEIGVYQDEVGSFPAWAELADATKKDRVRQGFTENDPLLRTGQLQQSISHQTELIETIIGSTDEVMVYQELGTPTIPPRPVLGPAVVRNAEKIRKVLGEAAVMGLLGGQAMERGIGYDFETHD